MAKKSDNADIENIGFINYISIKSLIFNKILPLFDYLVSCASCMSPLEDMYGDHYKAPCQEAGLLGEESNQ